MRKPERIVPFLKVLEDAWDEHPDWNFTKLLINIGLLPSDSEPMIETEHSRNVLSTIREEWKRNPDWRFTQLLVNTGIIPNLAGTWYYLEEYYFFPERRREFMFWGSYGKDGKGPLRQIAIKDMETEHIMACLDEIPMMADSHKKEMKAELKRRKVGNK